MTKRVVVIMDYMRFHKASTIMECFTRNGHEICFAPPYSPFLNPVQQVFSKLKEYVKSNKAENEEQLLKHMEDGFATITRLDCDGYYCRMKTYVGRSINNETIED
ncbi:hypothetical protein RF11_06454 [Thelohanellus kitauei]|uniref:Tc1-like transposase DDE domain-containing protein n=1 Tax=Thelohanellus kitauei TaxID=669202 RepID=A0A0C2NF59_THEKT|nr:hypothetical protein RF11_06454 [Thelohanellus kitauei]